MRAQIMDEISLWGKFSHPFDVYLYELTMVSGEDDRIGDSVDGPAIAWLLGRNVLVENSVGFVTRFKLDHKGQTLYEWCEANIPEIISWERQEDAESNEWSFG